MTAVAKCARRPRVWRRRRKAALGPSAVATEHDKRFQSGRCRRVELLDRRYAQRANRAAHSRPRHSARQGQAHRRGRPRTVAIPRSLARLLQSLLIPGQRWVFASKPNHSRRRSRHSAYRAGWHPRRWKQHGSWLLCRHGSTVRAMRRRTSWHRKEASPTPPRGEGQSQAHIESRHAHPPTRSFFSAFEIHQMPVLRKESPADEEARAMRRGAMDRTRHAARATRASGHRLGATLGATAENRSRT